MIDATHNQILQSPQLQNQALQSNDKTMQNLAADFQKASSAAENDVLAPFAEVIDTSAESAEAELMMEAMAAIIEQQLATMLYDISNSSLVSELDTASAFSVFGDEEAGF